MIRSIESNNITVVDSMAGIGAFTIPFLDKFRKSSSSRTHLEFYANDLNSSAIQSLERNLKLNQIVTPVTTSSIDAFLLIEEVLTTRHGATIYLIIGGTPGVTEPLLKQHMPRYIDLVVRNGHELYLTITSKQLKNLNCLVDDLTLAYPENLSPLNFPPKISIRNNGLHAFSLCFS